MAKGERSQWDEMPTFVVLELRDAIRVERLLIQTTAIVADLNNPSLALVVRALAGAAESMREAIQRDPGPSAN